MWDVVSKKKGVCSHLVSATETMVMMNAQRPGPTKLLYVSCVSLTPGDGGSGQTVGSHQYDQTGGTWRRDGHLALDAGRSTR